MAGSARYTALLDANTLYPAPLRDLLLSLAIAGLYHARWTRRIHEEWTRSLARNRPEIVERLPQLVELMNRSVPDSLVENYEVLAEGLVLPDADDRHVLAAAIVGHADAIVTFNLKDFPPSVLARHSIEALHPDDFVLNQLELRELDALAAIKAMRGRLRRPALSAAELIATFERAGLVATAAQLRRAQGLI
jgi:predicted nucleic acid-binding protein